MSLEYKSQEIIIPVANRGVEWMPESRNETSWESRSVPLGTGLTGAGSINSALVEEENSSILPVAQFFGTARTYREELELFVNALEELPEPPSNLLIDDADTLDPQDPFGFSSGKPGWYEIHKALEWEPKWGDLKPATYKEVRKRILEVERLNKPERNLRKRADSIRAIALIKDEVMKEVMSQ